MNERDQAAALQRLQAAWQPFLGSKCVHLFVYDGGELPNKFVQPYLEWRRSCEAAAPGACFLEPALTCFEPKVYRALIATAFFAVALSYLRSPDPWTPAVITRMLLTSAGDKVLTFANGLAAARDVVHERLPGQVHEPRRELPGHPGASPLTIAVRAWSHTHLILRWQEPDALAQAAERAGIYVPAHPGREYPQASDL